MKVTPSGEVDRDASLHLRCRPIPVILKPDASARPNTLRALVLFDVESGGSDSQYISVQVDEALEEQADGSSHVRVAVIVLYCQRDSALTWVEGSYCSHLQTMSRCTNELVTSLQSSSLNPCHGLRSNEIHIKQRKRELLRSLDYFWL